MTESYSRLICCYLFLYVRIIICSLLQLSASEREAQSGCVYELEEEVGRLKRELVRGREGELYETRGRCEQLTKTIEALEEQLGQQVYACIIIHECTYVRMCILHMY